MMTTVGARRRALDLLNHFPIGPSLRGAEVGVWRGFMSAALLDINPHLYLYMVDNWVGKAEWPMGYRPADMPSNKLRANVNTEFALERRRLLHADSVQAANLVANASLDFVYLDAGHSYADVRADIIAWAPKVRSGGWLCGDDYANTKIANDVQPAVDDAVAALGWKLELGPWTGWYVRMS